MIRTAANKIGLPACFLALLMASVAVPCAAQTAPHAVVLDGPGPWRDARWALGVTEFTNLLTDAGYEVSTLSPVDLPATSPSSGAFLAVPSLESLPLTCLKSINSLLVSGGSLMASGGEPFRDPLYPTADGSWIDQDTLLQALSSEKTVLNPVTATLSQAFYVPEAVTRTTVAGPDGQSAALDFQLQVPSTQYYLFTAPLVMPAFNAGQTATVVWTRGTPGQGMMFEWDETDGSRWIAIVPLSTQWTKHVLMPSQFRYYAGGPAARAGTTFNPAQASLLYFGVATNQGAFPGSIEFALGAIGVATPPPAYEPFTAPLLETLSPWYKQYVTQRAGQTVRVPNSRGRGLSATPDPDGRYRVIGNLLSPSATWYVTNGGTNVIWLPWPQLQDPDRNQLVTELRTAPDRLYLMNAGPTQMVVLPTETVALGARVRNWSTSAAQANLLWTITDATGNTAAQFTSTIALAAGGLLDVPVTNAGRLPAGDYVITASLVLASQEVDRIDSRVRVFDPASGYQPDQRIVVSNGAFSTAGGRRLFLQGVHYWPRYTIAQESTRFYQSWLAPQNYDPDVVEADLTNIASLNFNMVSIHYFGTEGARSLVDFLDRCRRHGIWVDIFVDVFGGGAPVILTRGQLLAINSSYIISLLQSAFLPGNDRVISYGLLSEPFLGFHKDRLVIDSAWRAWIMDQYGSAANAESSWGFAAPRDTLGQISNPLDSQIQNDGSWRVMVAVFRRFVDDFLSRSIGAAARLVRSVAPGTLISYHNGGSTAVNSDYTLLGEGLTMMQQMNYDFGTAAAHLDYIAPHAYFIPIPWPDGRGLGVEAAYARYRSGGKPVYWSEYGINIGSNGAGMATQAAVCDSVMQLVNDDGSGASSAWWMPGGWRPDEGSDYGILNPDGSPRQCAAALSQWAARFQAAPPAQPQSTPVKITIDRDADARGDVGVFLRWQKDYVTARQSGSPAVLIDAGTGTDTSTMPLVQVGNVPYTGSGPLKYANGEFAGFHVQCPGVDVRAENGTQINVPAGSACQITMTLVNTGPASWLPAAQGKGGVTLHTNAGDLPLQNSLGYLQRTDLGPLQVTAGVNELDITGRLNIQGVGSFGEILQLGLVSGARSSVIAPLTSGGDTVNATLGTSGAAQAGYATVIVKLGGAPYGTAVFSSRQNGVTVSEAGVPASPPTTSARIFIDYRAAANTIPGRTDAGTVDVTTGIAAVNYGSTIANVTYTLRSMTGAILASGHGTLAAGNHYARFINQLQDEAPDFKLPPDFPTATQFASLEIDSDQPLSIVAVRWTTNQRNEYLFTTTPTSDLTQPVGNGPIYFPQFVDGGGFVTALVLLNTSGLTETGTLQILDDKGGPLVVNQAGGTAGSSFRYSIPPGGMLRFQTDGSPAITNVGWAQLTPDVGSSTPTGAGVVSYNPGSVLITESGIPAAAPTIHARIYVDLSGNHDTGLAIANLSSGAANFTIRAFYSNGLTGIGTNQGPLQLPGHGHSAEFADQYVSGLPAGFAGVLDVASSTPFAALTVRSLVNERKEFLLTTFPIADQNQPALASIVFPQIADGGGFVTQIVLLSAGGPCSTVLYFFDEKGTPLPVAGGKN